ncbi:MAG: acetolactate decarboxylase [Verrucomicrobia bacterium]|nr:acetolactate decarboxylase [Verrucomicrobiota bacterium]
MKTIPFIALASLIILSTGCSSFQPRHTLTQTSTIDALLAGSYDGTMTCRELLTKGDFGLGTFDHLDGEMLILDGQVYQIKSDGKVYQPSLDLTTPFAAVCQFSPQESFTLPGKSDAEAVKRFLDQKVPDKNTFCAIKIKGTFRKMHTRSVPAQKKPYPLLADVAAHQPEFRMQNISGTIVGLRSPPFVTGIGVPGYHLHFISDDRKQGGHVLGFELTQGMAFTDVCNQFHLILPEGSEEFHQLDLSKDRSKELKQVEQ